MKNSRVHHLAGCMAGGRLCVYFTSSEIALACWVVVGRSVRAIYAEPGEPKLIGNSPDRPFRPPVQNET